VSTISTDLTADTNRSIEVTDGTLADPDGTIIEICIRILETLAGISLRRLKWKKEVGEMTENGETFEIKGNGVETLLLDGEE